MVNIWTPENAFAIILGYYLGFALSGISDDLLDREVKTTPFMVGGKFHLQAALKWLGRQWMIPTAFVVGGVILTLISTLFEDCPRVMCPMETYWSRFYEHFFNSVIGLQFIWVLLLTCYSLYLGFVWITRKTESKRARCAEVISSAVSGAWEKFPVRW